MLEQVPLIANTRDALVLQGTQNRTDLVRRYRVKTVTGLKLGVWVIQDTDDDHVKLAGAAALDNAGVYVRNITQPALGPDAAPTTEDEIEVAYPGSGAIVQAFVSIDALNGVLLNADANGYGTTAGSGAGDHRKVIGKKIGHTDGSVTATRGLVIL